MTVVLYPLNADGSTSAAVQAVLDDNLFTRLPAAQAGHVFGLQVERHRLRDREQLAERSENEGVCNALTLAHLFTACPQLTS